jgi:hypothetical protein
MSRKPPWPQSISKEIVRRLDERLKQLAVPHTVVAETMAGFVERSLQNGGSAVVE